MNSPKHDANPILHKKLKSLKADTNARNSGWLQRSGGKLTAESFCLTLLSCAQFKSASLRVLAITSGLLSSIAISKQALHKRVNSASLDYLRSLLAAAASSRLPSAGQAAKVCGFKRIVLQDSTSLALPAAMREAFPASGNAAASTAGMRVHATYDLVGQSFLWWIEGVMVDRRGHGGSKGSCGNCQLANRLIESGDQIVSRLSIWIHFSSAL